MTLIIIYILGVILSFIIIAMERDIVSQSMAPYSLAIIWPLWVAKAIYEWVKDVPNAFRYLKK